MTTQNMAELTDEQLRERIAEQGAASAAGFELARRRAERAAERISDVMSPDAPREAGTGRPEDARAGLPPESPTEASLPAEVVQTVDTATPTADEAQPEVEPGTGRVEGESQTERERRLIEAEREQDRADVPTIDDGEPEREGTTPGETTPTAPQTAVRSADVQPTVAVGGEGEGFREATEIESEAEQIRAQQAGVQAQIGEVRRRAEEAQREVAEEQARVQAEQQQAVQSFERDLAQRQAELQREQQAIERALELNPLDDPRVVEAINLQIDLYNEQAEQFQQEFGQRAQDLNEFLEQSTADLEQQRLEAIERVEERRGPTEEARQALEERIEGFTPRAEAEAARLAGVAERTEFGRSPQVAKAIAEQQLREAEMLQRSAEIRASDEFRETVERVEQFNELIEVNPNFLNPDLKEERLAAQKAVEQFEQDSRKLERLLLQETAQGDRERLLEELSREPITDEEVIERLEERNAAAARAERLLKPFTEQSFGEFIQSIGERRVETAELERQTGEEAGRLVVEAADAVLVDIPASVEVPLAVPGGFGAEGLSGGTVVRARPLDWRDANEAIGDWIEANAGTGAATVFRIGAPRTPLEALLIVTAAGDIARVTHRGGVLILKGIGEGPGAAQRATQRAFAAYQRSGPIQAEVAQAIRQGLVAPVGMAVGVGGPGAPVRVATRFNPPIQSGLPNVRIPSQQNLPILSRLSTAGKNTAVRAINRGFNRARNQAERAQLQQIRSEAAARLRAEQRSGRTQIRSQQERLRVNSEFARDLGVPDQFNQPGFAIRLQQSRSAREQAIATARAREDALRTAAQEARSEITGVASPSSPQVQAAVSLESAALAAQRTRQAIEQGRFDEIPSIRLTEDDLRQIDLRFGFAETTGTGAQAPGAVSQLRVEDVSVQAPRPTEVPTIDSVEAFDIETPSTPQFGRIERLEIGAQEEIEEEQPPSIPPPDEPPTFEPPIEPPSREPLGETPPPRERPPTRVPPPREPPPPQEPPPREPPPRKPPPEEPTRTRRTRLPDFEFQVEFDAPEGTNAPTQIAFRTGAIERRIDLLTMESEFGPDLSPNVPNDPRISPQDSLRIERFGNIDRRFVTFDAGRFMGRVDTRNRTVSFVPKSSRQGRAFQRRMTQEQRFTDQGFNDNEREGFGVDREERFPRDSRGRFVTRNRDAGFGRRRTAGFRRDV